MNPYIVAEISGNHCGSLPKSIDLIDAAKWAGADAVKLQCYTPEDMTIESSKKDFVIQGGQWEGRNLYELYACAQTPRGWFPELFDRARKHKLTIFSSVFSKESFDYLESLDCPIYKISSFEITDLPLINLVAWTKKPVIISTGMASDEEIRSAMACFEVGDDVTLLHCVSAYPSNTEDANLPRIGHLKKMFNCKVGLSDHTRGWEVPVAATALGVLMLEKHICMSRSDPTEDAAFSLEPGEFREMVTKVKDIGRAIRPSESQGENSSRQLRRSLYVVKDIRAGENFTAENMRSIRPSYGLPPRHYHEVIGKLATRDIERGAALTWNMVGK